MDAFNLYEIGTLGFWFILSGGFIWLLFQDAGRYTDREESLIKWLREKYQNGEISRREFEDVRKTVFGKH